MANADLSKLPRVDAVASHPELQRVAERLGRAATTRLARRAIDAARRRATEGEAVASIEDVAREARAMGEAALSARARPVINATGVVLHTNLGRAPLAEEAVRALAESAGRYTSIEIDLASGKRGARAAFAERALAELSGAEAALVVNNNAAAVLLVLSALAAKSRVVVSRGELVEIGGEFRVPDVCARSGAELVEVGTTNRTRASDYERAIDAGAVAAILRVHQGNFKQTGFVERPSLADLAALGKRRGVIVIEDLGGGALIDLRGHRLAGEPTVASSVAAGADVVCFSTDKVLGGPQGGAIVGRADLVERARRDPLARALRLGRLPLVALEATLACWLEGRVDDIPAMRAVRSSIDAIRARAKDWEERLIARGVAAKAIELDAAMGGGALAEAPLSSAGVAVAVDDADAFAERLRTGDPPVVGRIHEGQLLFDARTVLPGEDAAMIDAIARAARA